MNGSSTTISSTSQPAGFNSNGLITFMNTPTTAIIRADGGISNTSNWSATNAANINNGQILGGAARIRYLDNRNCRYKVGAISNSSGRANGDGNGDIVIGAGDGTSGGFFGTTVSAS